MGALHVVRQGQCLITTRRWCIGCPFLPSRLVAMEFAPLPKPQTATNNAAGKSPIDELLDGFSLKILANAYVILIQTRDAIQTLNLGATPPICGRTASNGTLRCITPEEADGAVLDESRTKRTDSNCRDA